MIEERTSLLDRFPQAEFRSTKAAVKQQVEINGFTKMQ